MKRIITVLTVCFLVSLSPLNASFPVSKDDSANKTEQLNDQNWALETNTEVHEFTDFAEPPSIAKEEATERFRDEDWILLALWFFLGGFAAHRWYAGKPIGWNILFILTAGGCGVWAIIDLIKIIKQDFM